MSFFKRDSFLPKINKFFSFDATDLRSRNFRFNYIGGDKIADPIRNRIRIVEDISAFPSELDEQKYYIYAPKESFDFLIRTGFLHKDLALYYRRSEEATNKIIGYHYPGRSWESITREVLYLRLRHLAKEGVLFSDLGKYFFYNTHTSKSILKNYKDPSFNFNVRPYTVGMVHWLVKRVLGGADKYNNLLLNLHIKPLLIEMYGSGFITKEFLRDLLITGSSSRFLDPINPGRGVGWLAFRWIFEKLYSSDIMTALSSKDYGNTWTLLPIQLLKDLKLYVEGSGAINFRIQRWLVGVIESMFLTSDLSKIYRQLNSRIL